MKLKDNGDGTLTLTAAVTVGSRPSIMDYDSVTWDGEDQVDAYDSFLDTLSADENKLIYSVDGVAELLNKAFRFGHAVVESWKDDSEKSKD